MGRPPTIPISKNSRTTGTARNTSRLAKVNSNPVNPETGILSIRIPGCSEKTFLICIALLDTFQTPKMFERLSEKKVIMRSY